MDIGHAKKLDAYTDGTKQWHAQRKQGLGGSDAACILGMIPYGKTRRDLWEQKRGEAEGFSGNTATDYGTRLEPYVFTRAEVEAEAIIEECDAQLVHPERAWQRGNIDGMTIGGQARGDAQVEGIVEIKTSTSPPPNTGAKDIHFAQIQHYLSVTGLGQCLYLYFEVPFDRWHALEVADRFVDDERADEYWQWVADQGDLTIRTIERDQGYIERLFEAEREFWACVQSGDEPGEYLREGEVELEDPNLIAALDDYGRAKACIKARKKAADIASAEAQKEDAKERAKSLLASVDAKKVYLPNGDKATYTSRGYWRLYPETRVADPDDQSPRFEVPF